MFKQAIAFSLAALFSAYSYSGTPQYLITHNKTPYQSMTYVDGRISLPKVSDPSSDTAILWLTVNKLCYGRTASNKCPLVIKMRTDSGYPFDLGVIYVDLKTGEINPKQLSNNQVTLKVNNVGEFTLN